MDREPFDWDPAKNEANVRKHGISFSQAAAVFEDPFLLEVADPTQSWDEDRWIALGMLPDWRMIVVVFVQRGGTIRMISARNATPSEVKTYERRERG